MKEMIDAMLETFADDIVRDTVRLCRVPSIRAAAKTGAPFGPEVGKALHLALAIGEELGFKAVNMDEKIGYLEYGQSEEYIAVLGHLDVVPPGRGWQSEPFAPLLHEGKIYARGALDDKGPMIASLYALKALKELGFRPATKIRLIFGLDEESNGEDIAHYKKFERPPCCGFTPDGRFPLVQGEKGLTTFWLRKQLTDDGPLLEFNGGIRSNMVPESCTARVRCEAVQPLAAIEAAVRSLKIACCLRQEADSLFIEISGRTAHASHPEQGVNAVMQMVGLLSVIVEAETDDLRFLRWAARFIGAETDGKSLGLAHADEKWGGLSLNVGLAKKSDQEIGLKLNVRYPLPLDFAKLKTAIEHFGEAEDISLEEAKNLPPLYFPDDSKLVRTLLQAYHLYERSGSAVISGGSTFAKALPNIAAFGPTFHPAENTAHQANENIGVNSLLKCGKIYANALHGLACLSP